MNPWGARFLRWSDLLAHAASHPLKSSSDAEHERYRTQAAPCRMPIRGVGDHDHRAHHLEQKAPLASGSLMRTHFLGNWISTMMHAKL
jgi:hypothetical protein